MWHWFLCGSPCSNLFNQRNYILSSWWQSVQEPLPRGLSFIFPTASIQPCRINTSSSSRISSFQRIEVERKTNQLAEREFESNIRQKQSELYSLDQTLKSLNREKDIMAGDSENRARLSLKKSDLENNKKKHRKMFVLFSFFPHYFWWFFCVSFILNLFCFFNCSVFVLELLVFTVDVLIFRVDEFKDGIRGVLKGRLPSDKDLKKEVTQVSRYSCHFIFLYDKSLKPVWCVS